MFSALKAAFRKRREPVIKPVDDVAPLRIRTDIEQPGAGSGAGLSKAPTIGELFPQVRHIAVNLVIRAPHNEIEPTMNGRSFGPNALAFFKFRCKNVECVEGGYDLTDVIELAVAQGKSDITGRDVCQGFEGRNRIHDVRCHYELNYKIHIAYL